MNTCQIHSNTIRIRHTVPDTRIQIKYVKIHVFHKYTKIRKEYTKYTYPEETTPICIENNTAPVLRAAPAHLAHGGTPVMNAQSHDLLDTRCMVHSNVRNVCMMTAAMRGS